MKTPVTKTFAAPDEVSDTMTVTDGRVAIFVGGTYTGTITLQCRPAGVDTDWVDTSIAVTAPGEPKPSNNIPGDWQYRMKATALSAGEAEAIMMGNDRL